MPCFCSKSFHGFLLLGVKAQTPFSRPFQTRLPGAASFSSPTVSLESRVPGITRRAVWILGLGCCQAQNASAFSPLCNTPIPYTWARVHRHTHTQGCAIPYPFSDDSLPFETQPPRCLLCKSSHSHNQTSASLPPWYFPFRLLRKHIIFFKGNFLFTNFKIARSKRAGSIVIWLRLHPQHLCLFVNLCEINNLVNLCCVFFLGGGRF